MAQFLSQLLKVVVVFGDNVFGDWFVAAVGLVEKHALLEEAAEQRSQQLGLRHARLQLQQELAAQTDNNRIHTTQTLCPMLVETLASNVL